MKQSANPIPCSDLTIKSTCIDSMRTLMTRGAMSDANRLGSVMVAFVLLGSWALPSNVNAQTGKALSTSQPLVYEGFTEPRHEILVAATEIGRLEEISVQVGDQVVAGQVIGQLEDRIQASSVRIAKLQTEMTGELAAARAEVDLHQRRTNALRRLASDGMARPDELVRAETDLRVASGRLLATQEQLELRKLELERFELQLQRRKIQVPMDGVISQLFHEPGEYITPSDPAVVRLLVMDTLFAVFNIPVEDTAVVQVGTPARIFLRSTSTTIEASVSSVAPEIDGESGTVQVRVELDNSDRKLLAGDRCTLQLAAPTSRTRSVRLPTPRTWNGGAKQR